MSDIFVGICRITEAFCFIENLVIIRVIYKQLMSSILNSNNFTLLLILIFPVSQICRSLDRALSSSKTPQWKKEKVLGVEEFRVLSQGVLS